ncbi:uncharacterized protein B0H18DRAFT_996353 [Fomitopsis serialis]|uniref:uncharacterized protein n=1 Tax=Fomitopsis serialis TaxID=139415 RepID=UPI002007CC2D|nr:uncharacterized protein B0H18DRAFT_996353 [Neoantrodia serialis]KAH9929809.1 hypothetical protein B0H18DRAFT_996353 [Neoantrodia serialis]
MSNFTTLDATPDTLSAEPPEQDVKAEPQIDALASSEAQPATSPSAGSGKDASPSAVHHCRRCGEHVKSVQFHQRTVHQKRCVVVFPDGTKETLIRPADGERFTCSKCSYGHRDPQYLQIHARQKCSGQPPEGGLKPETPRRPLETTGTDQSAIVKQETASDASSAPRAKADGKSRPRLEMPSIETIDRPRSTSASPSLSELQLELTEDVDPSTPGYSASAVSSAARSRRVADVSMDVDSPEPSPSHTAPSVLASIQTQSPSPDPILAFKKAPMTGGSNSASPMDAEGTSRSSSYGGLTVETNHPSAERLISQQPTPTTSIPPSPLLPQTSEDITGRFALVPAFPSQSRGATAAPPALHPTPALGAPGPGPTSSCRTPSHAVDAFLRGLSRTTPPPPHVARAFFELGYDTDELLDALAWGSPGEGDWDLLEKEIVVEKRFHAWWILVKNGLKARANR